MHTKTRDCSTLPQEFGALSTVLPYQGYNEKPLCTFGHLLSDLVSNAFCIQMISEWSGFIKLQEMDQIRDLELVRILRAEWEEAAENLLQQIIWQNWWDIRNKNGPLTVRGPKGRTWNMFLKNRAKIRCLKARVKRKMIQRHPGLGHAVLMMLAHYGPLCLVSNKAIPISPLLQNK